MLARVQHLGRVDACGGLPGVLGLLQGGGQHLSDLVGLLGSDQLRAQVLAGGLQVSVALVLQGQHPLCVQGVRGRHRRDAQMRDRRGQLVDLSGLVLVRVQSQQHDLGGPIALSAHGLGLVQVRGALLGERGTGVLGLALEQADQVVQVVDLTHPVSADDRGQARGDADQRDLHVLAPGCRGQLHGHGIEHLRRQLRVALDAQRAQPLQVQQDLSVRVVLAHGDQARPGGAGQIRIQLDRPGLQGPHRAVLSGGHERGRQLRRTHQVQRDLLGRDAYQKQLGQGRAGLLGPAGQPSLHDVELVCLISFGDDLQLRLDLGMLCLGHRHLLARTPAPALHRPTCAQHTKQSRSGEGADPAQGGPLHLFGLRGLCLGPI